VIEMKLFDTEKKSKAREIELKPLAHSGTEDIEITLLKNFKIILEDEGRNDISLIGEKALDKDGPSVQDLSKYIAKKLQGTEKWLGGESSSYGFGFDNSTNQDLPTLSFSGEYYKKYKEFIEAAGIEHQTSETHCSSSP
jgi:hypothetical protein